MSEPFDRYLDTADEAWLSVTECRRLEQDRPASDPNPMPRIRWWRRKR